MTLDEMLDVIRNNILMNEPIPPAKWIEYALRINVLAEDIDNQMAGMEAWMAEQQARMIKEGESAAKAKVLCVQEIEYADYLTLKAKRKRIDEYIMLAKKRAVVQNI